jgi:hypothetical protein
LYSRTGHAPHRIPEVVSDEQRPALSTITPTGRPYALPLPSSFRKPVTTSTGEPVRHDGGISINWFFELNGRVILSSCRNSDKKS